MGQAKRRGSYEERVQQAKERIAADYEARRLRMEEERARRQAEFDALPEEEKDKIRMARELRSRRRPMGALGLIALSSMLGGFGITDRRF